MIHEHLFSRNEIQELKELLEKNVEVLILLGDEMDILKKQIKEIEERLT